MERETQRPPEIDRALLERFKEDVRERKGRLRGHYSSELENALEAYLDASDGGDTNDRLARLESQVEDIHTAVTSDGRKKKTESSDTTGTTEKRLRKIRATVRDETAGGPKAHAEVVEKAIRQHAGSSAPTIRRYKRLLTQDNVLFEHPVKDNLYFRDAEDYVLAVNAMTKAGKVTQEEYDDLVESYGTDWWLKQQEDSTDESGKAFQ